MSIPAWFTVDTRLGSLSVHLETPQCFSAEMYAADLGIKGKPEDDKVVAITIIHASAKVLVFVKNCSTSYYFLYLTSDNFHVFAFIDIDYLPVVMSFYYIYYD